MICASDAQMIKANNKYIVKDPKFISAKSDFDLQSFMFQVYNKSQILCSHTLIVYSKPYGSLYTRHRDGFDINTREPFHIFQSDTEAIYLKKNFYSPDEKELIQSILKIKKLLISKHILEQRSR